jgi:cytoplasmic iron level regulating protein YaaA (DUF328/UPF0246 family)
MGTLPLILLPPSEGKASGGAGGPWQRGTMEIDLDDRREEVIAALIKAMKGSEASRVKLLGVKGKALSAATAADLHVRDHGTMPAIDRYTGVLYDALEHRSLKVAERRRLDRSVVIFSGLWGLARPADPIPDYKLKMGASLPGLGKLSTWWRQDLSKSLGAMAEGRRVWNLLPDEHAAAWRAPGDLSQYAVRFLQPRPDGSLKAVSHWNKFLKGALVRFLLADPSVDRVDLADWDHPAGYRYRPEMDAPGRDGVTVLSFVGSRG